MDVISLPVCKEVLEFGSGQKESSAQKPSLVFQLRNFAEVLFLLRNKSRKMGSSLHLMGFILSWNIVVKGHRIVASCECCKNLICLI